MGLPSWELAYPLLKVLLSRWFSELPVKGGSHYFRFLLTCLFQIWCRSGPTHQLAPGLGAKGTIDSFPLRRDGDGESHEGVGAPQLRGFSCHFWCCLSFWWINLGGETSDIFFHFLPPKKLGVQIFSHFGRVCHSFSNFWLGKKPPSRIYKFDISQGMDRWLHGWAWTLLPTGRLAELMDE